MGSRRPFEVLRLAWALQEVVEMLSCVGSHSRRAECCEAATRDDKSSAKASWRMDIQPYALLRA